MATPAIVQYVSSSSNVVGIQGQAGSNFKFTLPNACKAGNCIIIKITYPSGVGDPTVTDNIDTWPGTAQAKVDGGGNVAAIWRLLNTSAGYKTFHVAWGSAVAIPFQYVIEEWCNIATSSADNGSASAGNVSGSALATGAFTPTVNNDANGGNLIAAYFALNAGNFSGTPTSWTKGASFTLLAADVMAPTQGFGFAAEYFVQATQASINPGMTAPTGATDTYNCIAIALKAASAGSPKPAAGSGTIWINSIQHFSSTGVPATWTTQCPSFGDMRCVAITNGAAFSVTDSESSTYTSHGGNADGITAIVFEVAGKSANNSLTVSQTTTGITGNNNSMRYFDISNAANPPFDLRAFVNSGVGNVTFRDDFPDITPRTSNGLVIANGACGIGPCTGFHTGTPANAVFDMCTYPEETDGSAMENADMLGHYFNPNTNLITWNWTVTSTNAGANCIAVAYKAAPVSGGGATSQPFGIIGLGSSEW